MRKLTFILKGLGRDGSRRQRSRLRGVLIFGVLIFLTAPFARKDRFALALFPSFLDFGDEDVGVPSSIRMATAVNLSDRPVRVRTVVVEGMKAFRRREDNCSGVELARSESCTIGVEFLPGNHGASSAELLVTTGPQPSTARILLRGNGRQGEALRLHPHGHKFEAQLVGSRSLSVPITITNRGISRSFQRDGSDASEGEDFKISKETCTSIAVDSGHSCEVFIQFIPKVTGNRTASLTVDERGGVERPVTFKLQPGQSNQQLQRQAVHVVELSGDGAEANALQLVIKEVGEGRVESTVPGIRCPSECSAQFAQGIKVELRQTASDGWIFSGWGGGCTGRGICGVTMDGNKEVSAAFSKIPTPRTLMVRMEPVGGCPDTFVGSVELSPKGDTCRPMTAKELAFTKFLGAKVAPGASATAGPKPPRRTECSYQLETNTRVTLVASVNPPTTFEGYSGACDGPGPRCEVVMNEDKTVTAKFCSRLIIQ